MSETKHTQCRRCGNTSTCECAKIEAELLEALENLVDFVSEQANILNHGSTSGLLNDAMAAIAKAKGVRP